MREFISEETTCEIRSFQNNSVRAEALIATSNDLPSPLATGRSALKSFTNTLACTHS